MTRARRPHLLDKLPQERVEFIGIFQHRRMPALVKDMQARVRNDTMRGVGVLYRHDLVLLAHMTSVGTVSSCAESRISFKSSGFIPRQSTPVLSTRRAVRSDSSSCSTLTKSSNTSSEMREGSSKMAFKP